MMFGCSATNEGDRRQSMNAKRPSLSELVGRFMAESLSGDIEQTIIKVGVCG